MGYISSLPLDVVGATEKTWESRADLSDIEVGDFIAPVVVCAYPKSCIRPVYVLQLIRDP